MSLFNEGLPVQESIKEPRVTILIFGGEGTTMIMRVFSNEGGFAIGDLMALTIETRDGEARVIEAHTPVRYNQSYIPELGQSFDYQTPSVENPETWNNQTITVTRQLIKSPNSDEPVWSEL